MSDSLKNDILQAIQTEVQHSKPKIPIWEKAAMTLEEAAEYSSIGINQLREITNQQGCPFVFWIGRRRLIKRRAFDKYIDNLHVV